MRIGFSGSQGTGKTTLAQFLVSPTSNLKGKNWSTVPSTARAAQEAGYSINREADPLSQILTTIARINAENGLINEGKFVISDRTPIDSLAYTAYSFNNIWKDSNAFYWRQSAELCKDHMKKYDKVYYFPAYWPPAADGVRDTDHGWQKEIDEMILALLADFKVDFTVVPDVDVRKRAEWLIKTL